MENAGDHLSCGRCGQSWDYTKRAPLVSAKGQFKGATVARADRGWTQVKHKKGGHGPWAGWVDYAAPGPKGRPVPDPLASQGAKFFPPKFDDGSQVDPGEGNDTDHPEGSHEDVAKAKAHIKDLQENIEAYEKLKPNKSGSELEFIVDRLAEYSALLLKAQSDIPTPKPTVQTLQHLSRKAVKLDNQVAKNLAN